MDDQEGTVLLVVPSAVVFAEDLEVFVYLRSRHRLSQVGSANMELWCKDRMNKFHFFGASLRLSSV